MRASAPLGKRTPVTHVWYHAACDRWFNLGSFLDDERLQSLGNAWQLNAAVWNDGLFTMLATNILLVLRDEADFRRGQGSGFEDSELVVLVCSTIRRVVGPFQLLIDELLSNEEVRQSFTWTALSLATSKSDYQAS